VRRERIAAFFREEAAGRSKQTTIAAFSLRRGLKLLKGKKKEENGKIKIRNGEDGSGGTPWGFV
jgi:hypothetical protein